ncbi:hypothetical protein [Pseudomonas sp. Marseille-Q1929]|uniref:hypothetical protein n=1 Tax=Pseudomonas sp. Marseille-Q1929 TaxID=2730402 RepID=UPI001A8F8461|nr:hypothetical protein [Pseudomonas sp. Marseille-Q1929]MBO0492270.1 hypothetical protein [Pseudomonas sp. Marseille-Q1929]
MPPIATKNTPRAQLTTAMINQLSIGPAFREVAAALLRLQLREHYPDLNIDPDNVMVGAPSWEIIEDEVIVLSPHYEVLTDILARQAVLAVPSLFIEGVHFLTETPIVEPPIHLPVRVEEIARIINVLAPVMLRGYQYQQLAFWNQTLGNGGPNWHELSVELRNRWNVNKISGWTDDECLMLRQVALKPDLADRALDDPFSTHAYVLDIDQVDDAGKITHLNEHLISVVVAKQDKHDVILTHSLTMGFRKYANFDELSKDVPRLLDTAIPHQKIQWRLVEPDGDFFDYLACALVTIQIEAIGAINFSDLRGEGASQLALAGPPGSVSAGTSPGHNMNWLQGALPDWLARASISDLNSFSRYLKNLSALHNFNQGRTYDEGLPSIEEYALSRLREEMLKDHPDAASLSLGTLRLKVQSPVLWGLFPVPGQFTTDFYTVEQLALQNLISAPLGIKTLQQQIPFALPDWLTFDYLEMLISRIDIGSTYPQLVKDTLLGDPAETERRRTIYAQHLSIQMPLLALQCKLRGENGIDERGVRLAAAAFLPDPTDRQVDGFPVVVRPLGFIPSLRLDKTPDIVTNMYVISTQDPTDGPCLLYRPLLRVSLLQYPSYANLVYAIQQSPTLRESVLAWLPDNARDDYSHYVFPGKIPSPWTIADAISNNFKLISMSGPLGLSTDAITGDLLDTLYKANANALIELADRTSVSNAEARWETFKRVGWAIFSGVLPFLGRAVNAAAWIWQIMDQLQALSDAIENPSRQSPWAALCDLLLNLGMAVALHAAARAAPRPRAEAELADKQTDPSLPSPKPKPEPEPEPEPISVQKMHTLKPDQLPYKHPRLLHTLGALSRKPTQLGAVLDSFKVSKPQTLGDPIRTKGPHQYLHQSGEKYYAPVGERWFEVVPDENDQSFIVDAKDARRTGPPLIHNKQGQWFIDTRLRLRGGAPKVLVKKAISLGEERAEQMRKRLDEFEQKKPSLRTQLKDAYDAMEAGPSTSSAAAAEASRQAYLGTLKQQCIEYESALQALKQLSVHAHTPDYLRRTLGILKAQTEMTQAGINQTNTRFQPKLSDMLDKIKRQAEAPQERYIDEALKTNDLIGAMFKHLEYMEGRLDELRALGEDGANLRRDTQHLLPSYKSVDLKVLQVTLARNLCLPASTTASAPHAWKAIDQIVDTADLAILGLRDTLYERSESRLDERIDILSNLTEQFQTLDERLEDFSEQFHEHAIDQNVQTLRQHLNGFRRDAIHNLSVLSAERDVVRSRGTPLPVAPPVHRKIIRTLHDGMLVGVPRLDKAWQDTGLVDITSPLTEKVIATYHQKDGVWLRHWESAPVTPTVDLFTAASQGQALLDELPAFLERAQRQAIAPQRTPSGIEYLYHQHAQILENSRNVISRALKQDNLRGINFHSATTVESALKNAVTDLNKRSDEFTTRALKASPPTVTGVEWLKQRNLISIKQTGVRKPLVKSAKPLYLDEYVIRDLQTKEALWYAQFHYSETWSSAERYLDGRLISVEDHQASGDADSISSTSQSQRINQLRSEISLQPAKDLFFEPLKTKRRFWKKRP